MKSSESKLIGFACAYTPLALIDACGFVPYRLLPLGDSPEKGGMLLHDNICPHVKRILDRALSDDIPELFGIVFMNSCDAMRRLADAWLMTRPSDRVVVVDLPANRSKSSINYFGKELARLANVLAGWGGCELTDEKIGGSIGRYRELSFAIDILSRRAHDGTLKGGMETMQKIYNQSVTLPIDEVLASINQKLAEPETPAEQGAGVPVYLMGNVLVDPMALAIFEKCGAQIIAGDICTGSRMHATIDFSGSEDVFTRLARGLLLRRACARTFDAAEPGGIARDVVERVKSCGARGVIVHVMKFCDPYLTRLPYISEALRTVGIPVLVLDGDCSLRSIGQFTTRIEAFVEMLNRGEK